jgi:hypothetical protein
MITLVFLLEEKSMKITLEALIPKLKLSEHISYKYIAHSGKQDLEKSIPIKLKGWNIPHSYFIIVRDKDKEDGIALKRKLVRLCEEYGREMSLVRIVVHELESWFLGDMKAIATAYNQQNIAKKQKQQKYRNPDALEKPSQEMQRIIGDYRKPVAAEKIAPYLDIDHNQSSSFNCFVHGMRSFSIKCLNNVTF